VSAFFNCALEINFLDLYIQYKKRGLKVVRQLVGSPGQGGRLNEVETGLNWAGGLEVVGLSKNDNEQIDFFSLTVSGPPRFFTG
jgi:hypothetical protein